MEINEYQSRVIMLWNTAKLVETSPIEQLLRVAECARTTALKSAPPELYKANAPKMRQDIAMLQAMLTLKQLLLAIR